MTTGWSSPEGQTRRPPWALARPFPRAAPNQSYATRARLAALDAARLAPLLALVRRGARRQTLLTSFTTALAPKTSLLLAVRPRRFFPLC